MDFTCAKCLDHSSEVTTSHTNLVDWLKFPGNVSTNDTSVEGTFADQVHVLGSERELLLKLANCTSDEC